MSNKEIYDGLFGLLVALGRVNPELLKSMADYGATELKVNFMSLLGRKTLDAIAHGDVFVCLVAQDALKILEAEDEISTNIVN